MNIFSLLCTIIFIVVSASDDDFLTAHEDFNNPVNLSSTAQLPSAPGR